MKTKTETGNMFVSRSLTHQVGIDKEGKARGGGGGEDRKRLADIQFCSISFASKSQRRMEACTTTTTARLTPLNVMTTRSRLHSRHVFVNTDIVHMQGWAGSYIKQNSTFGDP